MTRYDAFYRLFLCIEICYNKGIESGVKIMQKENIKKAQNEIPEEHLAVLQEIKNAPNKYITKEKLLIKLELPNSYWRTLNSIISDLIIKYGYVIGSTRHNGYYLCESDEDIDKAIYTLESLNGGIFRRIEVLRKAKENKEKA